MTNALSLWRADALTAPTTATERAPMARGILRTVSQDYVVGAPASALAANEYTSQVNGKIGGTASSGTSGMKKENLRAPRRTSTIRIRRSRASTGTTATTTAPTPMRAPTTTTTVRGERQDR